MRTRTYVVLQIVAVLALAVGIMPKAHAFYPNGFFHAVTGELIFPTWPLDYMDTNGDCDVSGTDEGILLNFESGVNGFTDEEKAKVIAGFETWEAVPSAYVAFCYGQDISDPVELEAGFDAIDLINMVSLEVPEDSYQVVASGGSYVYTFEAIVYEDTFLTVGGVSIPVTGGQIVDVDTVFDGEKNREHEAEFGSAFQGDAVLAGGGIIGLGYSPFVNFDETASTTAELNIEKRVVYLRNASGELEKIGVTPSMVNDWFFYSENSGYVDSTEDLAPDDIAGVTFLYPRSDADLFFDIGEEARSQTRTGYPSMPLSGAHIMAWCDTDNSAASGPVPFIDTLTGLYVDEESLRGQFILRRLFKQLEDQNGTAFSAQYYISCQEFEPYIFEQAEFDTTHGVSSSTKAITFDTLFPSEVFNEYGNVSGVENVAQGTPLYYNAATRQIGSATTGKSLDTILAAGRPMFGDPNLVCPLNVVVAGLGTNRGPSALRNVRDSLLLNTALGVALMDAYYRVAPSAAEFLISHGRILAAARLAARGVEWVLGNTPAVMAAVAVGVGLAVCRRWRKRARAVVTVLLAAALLTAFALPASARGEFKDAEEFVAASDDILTGKVTAADSRWTSDGTRIVTDVTIEVDDVVKGGLNKSGNVCLTLPIGRVGAIERRCRQLPAFEQDEEVLVFLQTTEKAGCMVVGGAVGKYNIRTDEETGEKYVYAGSRETKVVLDRAAAKIKASGETDDQADTESEETAQRPNAVSLDVFKDYLRDIDKEQRRAK